MFACRIMKGHSNLTTYLPYLEEYLTKRGLHIWIRTGNTPGEIRMIHAWHVRQEARDIVALRRRLAGHPPVHQRTEPE